VHEVVAESVTVDAQYNLVFLDSRMDMQEATEPHVVTIVAHGAWSFVQWKYWVG
jgi:hypothetical protein